MIDSFKPVVTAPDGTVRGVPFGSAMGGGIYYNKKIYAELGLSVPKTWAEFMANNEKIKAAGKVAVAQTYGDTWSSQLFVLADFFNVQAQSRPLPPTTPQQGEIRHILRRRWRAFSIWRMCSRRAT